MATSDLEAIDSYISNTPVRTPEAGNLQAQWKTWYGNLNFINKSLDSTFKEASNRRTVFNAANQEPEDLTHAADLDMNRKVEKQSAIAAAPGLSPQQKAAALAKNPTIPTTQSVPSSAVKRATIKAGSKGPDVVAWQQILGIKADGIFGSGTTSATKTFQTKHGLTADGVVGPKTWSAVVGAPVQEAAVVTNNPLPPVSPSFPPEKKDQLPIISPTPAVHEAAAKLPITAAINMTGGIKTPPVIVKPKAFNAPVAAALVGVPTIAGGVFFGPIGAFVGAGIGALTDIFAVK